MIPKKLYALLAKKGKPGAYKASAVFHSQDFVETIFMVKSGYVKRYQLNSNQEEGVIELIYGPGQLFPLTQLYTELFNVTMNEDSLIYIYQAMTDVETFKLPAKTLVSLMDKDLSLYKDLFYESGLKLRQNIHRLASNSIKDTYKKVAHQLYVLAMEFGQNYETKGQKVIKILVPMSPKDIAEQLNISVAEADAVLESLLDRKIIDIQDNYLHVIDKELLQAIFL
ncbi:MAG TPA: Crp/Fnr family transcriptional regulator [Candidatus Saccharimonadales bacterium]|nr:Crp/Fnr family transcriptional regulator [Candidatus Saccharimonadales bacterium]